MGGAVGSELQIFLKERDPKTSIELVGLVEKYAEAHGTRTAFSKDQVKRRNDLRPQEREDRKYTQLQDRDKRKTITCHKCGKLGHVAKECWGRPQKAAALEFKPVRTCTFCGKRGHVIEKCWERKRSEQSSGGAAEKGLPEAGGKGQGQLDCGCTAPLVSAACHGEDKPTEGPMPVAKGRLNEAYDVQVLRDSGCSCVVVKESFIPLTESTAQGQTIVRLADGKHVNARLATIHLECPYFSGKVKAVVMKNPIYDVILGNIPGAKCPGTPVCEQKASDTEDVSSASDVTRTDVDDEKVTAVVTRRQQNQKHHKKALSTPLAVETGVTIDQLKEKQGQDQSLQAARRAALSSDVRKTGRNTSWYCYEKGLLIRYFRSPQVDNGDVIRQVVVPNDLRGSVMRLAHESILSGHLAAKKTTERILSNFFWPNIWDDVVRFCRSCDQCQRSTPKGATPK
ncbi:reverse transcriptase, partial [Elysia marginata]